MKEINTSDECPYCGSKAISQIIEKHEGFKYVEYMCLKCGHFTLKYGKDDN